ncbi:uncharacterized protein LOC114525964 [Dendronephthya gigantea]|uniref:uncharacterized protein LOC114525964 n=1 Tax=Dendronephthya gigantea TaxID=151771 RepID=UPI001069CADC|nr:uncharacterized protein LOC114525964 [Dendronephthya gigantea]
MFRFRKKIFNFFILWIVFALLYFRWKSPAVEENRNVTPPHFEHDVEILPTTHAVTYKSTLPTSSLTTTLATRKPVVQYLKVGYFDVKGNDLACDKDGKCAEFRVRNPQQAMTLCNSYGAELCKGFVFSPNTGRLFLKTSVSAEPVHEPFWEFYVREDFRGNIDLLKEKQCAIPVDGYKDSYPFNCSLPVLDPFHANIMKFIDKDKTVIVCQGEHYTTYRDGVLSLLRTDFKTMRVKAIKRRPHSDWDFDFTPLHFNTLQENLTKINKEFLQIETTGESGKKVIEYHAQAVPKAEVLKRKRKGKGLNANVLLLGFDSTSSAQMQRALPNVYKFLKDDLNSFMFRGYSIVGDGTTPQLTAMLTGQTEAELPEARRGFPNSTTVDSWPWIFRDFRNHGYATLYSEDDPIFNAFNYRLYGFREPPADHYTRPFWQAARTAGYCIESTPQPQIHLDYIESFLKAYENIPKFGLAFLAQISHSNMNTLRPAEEFVLNFFKSIKEKGYLNDTILITFSDHGMRFGDARATMQSRLEERLPFLSITLPKRIRQEFPRLEEVLRENTQKLLSPFDIHATLHHILSYPKPTNRSEKVGLSLFQEIPKDRSCTSCGIPEHYCPCVQLQKVPTAHVHVQKAAEGLVAHINAILKRDKLASRMCSTLKLSEIRSAYQNLNHPKLVRFIGSKDIHGRIPRFRNDTGDYECNYQLLVRTVPGGGLFEATVQLLDGKFQYGKEISRINKYGDQPRCIAEKRPYLRKFCYCH